MKTIEKRDSNVSSIDFIVDRNHTVREWYALILTFSPRRRNRQWPRWKDSLTGNVLQCLQRMLPLLGESGGVRENVSVQLNRYGLKRDKCQP